MKRVTDRFKAMSDRINAIPEGRAMRISHYEITDLPTLPEWAYFANITMGFERVKESVIGSSHPHLWSFFDEPNGDITVYRKPTLKAPHHG